MGLYDVRESEGSTESLVRVLTTNPSTPKIADSVASISRGIFHHLPFFPGSRLFPLGIFFEKSETNQNQKRSRIRFRNRCTTAIRTVNENFIPCAKNRP